MRRHPPHHLSPAQANHPAGQDPEARSAASSHHSNAPIKTESQSFLSKIVALMQRIVTRTGFTSSEFESSRPSQPVRRPEKLPPILAKRPANGGLLLIRHRSPGSDLRHFLTKIAGSLRRTFEKFPFLGDVGRRLGSICTAWPSWQCKSPYSLPWPPADRERG